MFKKLIPLVLMVFISACTTTQSPSGTEMKRPCCEKCECCKSGKCGECCKSGECSCCKDGNCTMCMKGKAAKGDEGCPECAKAEREWQAKQGTMKH